MSFIEITMEIFIVYIPVFDPEMYFVRPNKQYNVYFASNIQVFIIFFLHEFL